ncbi:MAG: UDP-3-O-(3-hydroxymyristoyl)glucosamine N-acyltransferase [Neisseriaceae bacterium]|nr:UDP-3-O-(3-hydroxymyristoyl)glucosamine N-acyltransferase [Neisseriaceae bacterium]MBP6862849.1 UDP-3-O-(3-hydroxymyristoyl)glucosamine N-acyltransferase [Neisseriaceae bacterium]
MTLLLSQIVTQLGGELVGPDVSVTKVAPLDSAQAEQISFLANPKYRHSLEASRAGAVIVSQKMGTELVPAGMSAIVTQDPYLYFAKVARLFTPVPQAQGVVHPTAVIMPGAIVPASCDVGAQVYIGEDAVLGEGCRILPGTVIEAGCVLGDEVCLHANVTLYPQCVLGNRVEVHSGTVIGADGFGMAWDKTQWFKIPQTGRVILADDVEVGANTTIDRGALDDTVIHTGAKIDNLVQIAHNVQVGAHSAIAGCTGIAGSTKIGAYCTIGGAAMFVGHIEVADKTFIGGGTLVSKSIDEPGHYASSYPLARHKDWVRNAVHLRHLNDMAKKIKQLEQQLALLSANNEKE